MADQPIDPPDQEAKDPDRKLDPEESASTETPAEKDVHSALLITGAIGGALLVLMLLGLHSCLSRATMTIAAHAEYAEAVPTNGPSLTVQGRALIEGQAAEKASVWMTVIGSDGNRYCSDAAKADGNGNFTLSINDRSAWNLRKDANTVIVVSATLDRPWYRGDVSAETDIRKMSQLVKIVPRWLILALLGMVLLFILSLLALYFRAVWPVLDHFTLGITVGLPIFMVIVAAAGMHNFHSQFRPGQTVTLGFANMYEASFAEGVPKEWVLSFTSPPQVRCPSDTKSPISKTDQTEEPADGAEDASPDETPPEPSRETTTEPEPTEQEETATEESEVTKGFGAPLWVLMLSIVGAALFTFAFVLRQFHHLREEPMTEARTKTAKRMVEHQFYMFFAPLGGVFLYQLLVMSSMAAEPVTVAMLTLGAGASLNLLLAKASKMVASVASGGSNAGAAGN